MKRNHITQKLKPYAFFLIFFPISYFFIILVIFNIHFIPAFEIFFSIWNSLLMIGITLSGYGFLKSRRWAWYVFICFQILLSIHTLFLVDDIPSHFRWLLIFFFIALQVFFTARISKIVRVPYIYPRIRWWEHNPYFRGSIPAEIQIKSIQKTAEILDLNNQGCFIKITTESFSLDQQIQVNFQQFSHTFQLPGLIVWIATSAVTRPHGLGIRFIGLSKEQKKDLKNASKRISKLNRFYQRNRYFMNNDEFSKELVRLSTTPLYGPE